MSDIAIKERPILFSGEMVRAILEGRKTKTRRAIKIPGPEITSIARITMPFGAEEAHRNGFLLERWPEQPRCMGDFGRCERIHCPYGKPGDRLWVRETWASPEPDKSKQGRVAYDADGVCGCWCGGGEDRGFIYHGRVLEASGYHQCFPKEGSSTFSLGKYTDLRSGKYPSYKYGWRPSIHMPRWASRITLEITGVRVERVQDISEQDARAEGCDFDDGEAPPGFDEADRPTARIEFQNLWDSINGARPYCAWKDNPWVWVVEFKRVS